MELLALGGNQLEGEIPAELGNLAGLVRLNLGNNQLSGCIPLTLVYHRYLASTEFGGLKGCESPDRAALVSFYRATSDPEGWRERENWLSDTLIGDWYGVEVNERGRVEILNLRSNRLIGEIPAELADLAELRELDLGGSGGNGTGR